MALLSGILVQLSLLGLLVYLVNFFLRRRSLVSRLSWVPGPPALPLLGNLVEFCLCSHEEIFKKMQEYTKKYGTIYKIWMGPTPVIICQDAELLQKILKNDDVVVKSDQYTIMGKFLGDGLATIQMGDKWRLHRKSLTTSFHVEVYEYLAIVTSEKSLALNNFFLNFAKKEETFDILHHMKRFTFDLTMKSISALDFNTLEGHDSTEFQKIVESFSDLVMRRTFLPLLRYNFIYNLTPLKKKEVELRLRIDKFAAEVLSRKKQAQNMETIDERIINLKERTIALDNLLQLNKSNPQGFSDQDVVDELTTFLFAGYDTLANSTSFTLFLLSHNPEYQEKLVKELDTHVPNCLTEGIKLKDLSKLELLDRCLKESMRIFPPGALIGRTLTAPISQSGGTLPAGVDVFVNFFELHRNERVFPEATRFDPDRFLPHQVEKRDPLSYIPFGAGSRVCIGKKQAIIQAKIIISIVLKKYYVIPAERIEDLELMADIVLKSKNGLKVKFRER